MSKVNERRQPEDLVWFLKRAIMSFLFGSRKAIARGSERGKSPLLRFASFMCVSRTGVNRVRFDHE